jgi:hypothetical protein
MQPAVGAAGTDDRLTRNVLLGGVMGLAVALVLSPIIVIFQDQMGQLVMAAAGGILVWLWERRGPTTG